MSPSKLLLANYFYISQRSIYYRKGYQQQIVLSKNIADPTLTQ